MSSQTVEILLQQFFEATTALGSTYAILIYVLTLWLIGEKKLSKVLLIATFLTRLLADGLKILVARPRPSGAELLTYSFPSGHAALSFMAAAVLGYRYKELRVWFLVLAGVVAMSRVFLELHYLSDVVAGAVLGYVIGVFMVRKF